MEPAASLFSSPSSPADSSSSIVIPDDYYLSPLHESAFPSSVASTVLTIPDGLLSPPTPSISTAVRRPLPSNSLTSPLAYLSAVGKPQSTLISPIFGTTVLQNPSSNMGINIPLYQGLPLPNSSKVTQFYPPELGNNKATLPTLPDYVDPSLVYANKIGELPLDPTKYKYICVPCQVYFTSSQALGGHMSYHSKEKSGIPISSVRTTSAAEKAAAAAAAERSKKNLAGISPTSKKIGKGKEAAGRKVPALVSNKVNNKTNTTKRNSPAVNMPTETKQSMKEKVVASVKLEMPKAATTGPGASYADVGAEVVEITQDEFSAIIEEMLRADVNDFDFSSLLDN